MGWGGGYKGCPPFFAPLPLVTFRSGAGTKQRNSSTWPTASQSEKSSTGACTRWAKRKSLTAFAIRRPPNLGGHKVKLPPPSVHKPPLLGFPPPTHPPQCCQPPSLCLTWGSCCRSGCGPRGTPCPAPSRGGSPPNSRRNRGWKHPPALAGPRNRNRGPGWGKKKKVSNGYK